jgi:protein CpxP
MKSSSKIIISMVAAGLMATGAAAVAASGAGDCGGPRSIHNGVHGAHFDPSARAEQRLSRLKADLNITADQEPLWQAFADRVKSEAGGGLRAMREQAKDDNLTAPERMARMTDVMKQRLAVMESVGDAFNRLYQGLTPEQRRIADERATRMMHAGFGDQAGPMRHRGQPPAEAVKG